MAAVVKAGTQDGAGTVTFGYHVLVLKLRNKHATVAGEVKLNGHSVKLPINMDHYEDFPVDATDMEVVAGTIDYVVIG